MIPIWFRRCSKVHWQSDWLFISSRALYNTEYSARYCAYYSWFNNQLNTELCNFMLRFYCWHKSHNIGRNIAFIGKDGEVLCLGGSSKSPNIWVVTLCPKILEYKSSNPKRIFQTQGEAFPFPSHASSSFSAPSSMKLGQIFVQWKSSYNATSGYSHPHLRKITKQVDTPVLAPSLTPI